MKYIIRTVIILMFIIVNHNVYSCDCIWHGTFLEISKRVDIVLTGKVKSYDHYINIKGSSEKKATVMVIEVKDVILPLKSFESLGIPYYKWLNNEKIKEIKIVGNIENNCRPLVGTFEIGKTYVFGLNFFKSLELHNLYGIDFYISNCGTYWLEVNNEVVVGNISDSKEQKIRKDKVNIEMNYSILKANLESVKRD